MAVTLEILQPIPIKSMPDGRERLIQDLIAKDPSVLTLGRLELQARERIQSSGGRLDFILRDDNNDIWYEVEIQLGKTDESHIIRTIEYWETEKRRHPEINHVAVIVAEEITGRFFNVIHLLNQNIPVIALQMSATRLGNGYGLLFTKVLGHERPSDRSEESQAEVPATYWEQKSAPFAMKAAVELVKYARANFRQTIEARYNRNYIGTWIQGRVSNFVTFNPQRHALRISFHCSRTSKFDKQLEDLGIEWEYKVGTHPRYVLRLLESEIHEYHKLIKDLMKQSFEECEGEDSGAEDEDDG